MPFPQYVQARLFAPLGMASSTLDAAAAKRNGDRAEGSMFGLERLPYVMPFPGAGSVYTSASDLAKFVQFRLNLGRVDGRQLLKRKYLLEMDTPFITGDYALGIAIVDQDGRFALNHNGGGFGWGATMTWYPQYGIGCVILTNGQYAPGLYETAKRILDDCIDSGFAARDTTFKFDPVAHFRSHAVKTPSTPLTPCPGDSILKPEWGRYTGRYNFIFGPGFVFNWYAKIARWFGYRVQKVVVVAKDNGLYLTYFDGVAHHDPQRLREYLPGLFFTPDGEALDLRAEQPTYRNLKLARK